MLKIIWNKSWGWLDRLLLCQWFFHKYVFDPEEVKDVCIYCGYERSILSSRQSKAKNIRVRLDDDFTVVTTEEEDRKIRMDVMEYYGVNDRDDSK